MFDHREHDSDRPDDNPYRTQLEALRLWVPTIEWPGTLPELQESRLMVNELRRSTQRGRGQ